MWCWWGFSYTVLVTWGAPYFRGMWVPAGFGQMKHDHGREILQELLNVFGSRVPELQVVGVRVNAFQKYHYLLKLLLYQIFGSCLGSCSRLSIGLDSLTQYSYIHSFFLRFTAGCFQLHLFQKTLILPCPDIIFGWLQIHHSDSFMT